MSDFTNPEPIAHVEYADLDGDGVQESLLEDTNNDGEIDTVLTDINTDGVYDVAGFDNAPGDHEFVADVIAVDVDSDGRTDAVFDDVNFDGNFDTVSPGDGGGLEQANPYSLPQGDSSPFDLPERPDPSGRS